MSSLSIFTGITDEEKKHMFQCFSPSARVFFDGEIIMNYSYKIDRIGILLDGRAHLSSIDYDGRQSILEQLEQNDIFGEVFTLPLENCQYFVEADTACDVLFIDYAQIIKRCPRACSEHSRLVNNLLQMTAAKAQSLAIHINILSRRSIRQKLTAYFEAEANKSKKEYFELPMSLSAPADYISVDRSAMMRELKKMKDDGVLLDKLNGSTHLYAIKSDSV